LGASSDIDINKVHGLKNDIKRKKGRWELFFESNEERNDGQVVEESKNDKERPRACESKLNFIFYFEFGFIPFLLVFFSTGFSVVLSSF